MTCISTTFISIPTFPSCTDRRDHDCPDVFLIAQCCRDKLTAHALITATTPGNEKETKDLFRTSKEKSQHRPILFETTGRLVKFQAPPISTPHPLSPWGGEVSPVTRVLQRQHRRWGHWSGVGTVLVILGLWPLLTLEPLFFFSRVACGHLTSSPTWTPTPCPRVSAHHPPAQDSIWFSSLGASPVLACLNTLRCTTRVIMTQIAGPWDVACSPRPLLPMLSDTEPRLSRKQNPGAIKFLVFQITAMIAGYVLLFFFPEFIPSFLFVRSLVFRFNPTIVKFAHQLSSS